MTSRAAEHLSVRGQRGDWIWQLTSRYAEKDDLLTLLHLEDASGRKRESGFAGPPLPVGKLQNAYLGQKEGFPTVVLARMVPADSVVILTQDGAREAPLWEGSAHGLTYILHLSERAQAVQLEVRRGSTTEREPLHS